MLQNQVVNISEFFSLANEIPMVDVRTPAEYFEGHIPGAINIPLFSDDERKTVGTLYTKKGSYPALLAGLKCTGKKLHTFVEKAHSLGSEKLLLYCWRGGMRSSSMAWLFNLSGIQTLTLQGGYKAYRRNIRESFSKPLRLVVLGGLTGSGKTEILQELKHHNQQIIDLEDLANHKGSAFGALGKDPQPTTEHYENLIFNEWRKLDTDKPVWVEDESFSVGSVNNPETLFKQMRKAPLIHICIDPEVRIQRLVDEYGTFDPELLHQKMQKINKKIEPAELNKALEGIAQGQIREAVIIALKYYDRAYLKATSKRDPLSIFKTNFKHGNPEELQKIIDLAESLFIS